MKVSMPGFFKNVVRAMRSDDPEGAKQFAGQCEVVFEEIEKHLRETIRGEHTLAEFAAFYCLDEKPAASCKEAAK